MYASEPLLDERKQKILKAVVHEHVGSAEPVGSEVLVLHYDFGVKSATVRNEMAELADMGYLRQPHTSAGRVPSDLGYRFYVDRLMGRAVLSRREAAKAKEKLSSVAQELELAISQTCRMLAALTRCTCVATPPSAEDTVIHHISVSKVGRWKLLLVIALSDGRVEHRIHDPGAHLTCADVEKISNMLASRYVGRSIDAVDTLKMDEDFCPRDPLRADVISALRQLVESLSPDEEEACVEGTSYILTQPEFKDLLRLEGILAALEERKRLFQFLSKAMLGPEVTVIIGSENPYRDMHETSFVGSRYKIGDRVVGTIGVIGPTRMDYRRAIAAVEAMASNLSNLLTVLSFG